MAWLRTGLALAAALVAASCFAPELVPCAFRCADGDCPSGMECLTDGFCHPPLEGPNCSVRGDGQVVSFIDARPLSDARPADAPLADGPPAVDAGPGDARSADARPDAPLVIADAGPADARPIDAFGPSIDASPDCVDVCSDPRLCDFHDGCDCGPICFDADWCGSNCVFAVCEEGNCCLPEGSICDVGLGQCCDGFTCVVFCVAL